MNSRSAQEDWKPWRQWGQTLSEVTKEPTTNCPGLMSRTSPPTSTTVPQYSCPMCIGAVTGFAPR